jgi:hypothetical protein
MRRTVFGYLFFLALAIPASGIKPEPSCERQAVEAVRPSVHAAIREGSDSATMRYLYVPAHDAELRR